MKKRKCLLILAAAAGMLVSGCHSYRDSSRPVGKQAEALAGPAASVENEIANGVLAAYVSNEKTELVTKLICDETGADILKLPLEQGQGLELSRYGSVFLIFSMSSDELPEAVTSFLSQDGLKEKTVIPVCMTPGADAEALNQMILECISEIELMDAFFEPSKDTLTRDINTWLSDMGYHQ